MKKLLFSIIFVLLLVSCKTEDSNNKEEISFKNEYGVFLSISPKEKEKLKDYHIVVIDADYFTKEDITTLKNENHIVYTYINLGSLENFRSYYDDYKDITIKDYENWSEERWVDVSNVRWQNHMKDISSSFIEKGIDGFFVDNVDVYYYNKSDSIYNGVTIILKDLMKYNKKVVINGGDEYMYKYSNIKEVATGINQESVFSSIDFDNHELVTQEPEDHEYFKEYVEFGASKGLDIYLLEYTTDKDLIDKIIKYTSEKGFKYYISDSIELD